MYDSYFGKTEEYTSREALDRAYALGVASVCGDPDEAAYDDLKRNSPDTYDESIVELAYEEGRANALDIEAEAEGEVIWKRLVESEFGSDYSGADAEEGRTEGLPDALRGREDTGPTEGPPERLGLPSFLRR